MRILILLLVLCSACFAQTTKILGVSDLQNYWPFEDLSGGSTTARFGGVNGTVTGTTLVQGVLGNCLSFNGTTDKVDCGTTVRPAANQAFSVSVWFNITTLGATLPCIFGNTAAGGTGLRLGVLHSNSDKLQFVVFKDGTNFRRADAGVSTTAGVWHFCVGTWDGSSVASLYLDGAKTSNSLTSGTVNSIAYSLNAFIGCSGTLPDNPFPGKIDDFKYYNHAMTQSEVNYLYYAGRRGIK